MLLRLRGAAAVAHAIGPSNDAPHLATLERRASRYGRHDERGYPAWVMLADNGFDSAKMRHHPTDSARWQSEGSAARAELVSHAWLDGLFGQRWKNETVNSVIKRKFGDAVRSVKRAHQNHKRRVIYNAHRQLHLRLVGFSTEQ